MTRNLLQDDLGRTITLSSKIYTKSTNLSDNIETITGLSSLLQTSLGPNGLDKILQSPHDDLVVTNDGATILKNMEMNTNPISKLLQRLSAAVDDEIGDGTTSVVILASAILKKAEELISKGIHPIKISQGFDLATKIILKHLEKIKEELKPTKDTLKSAAMTALYSKIVSRHKDLFSEICVNAISKVQDERKDVDFELIKIVKKIGTSFAQSELIHGVLLDKSLSHPQMKLSGIESKIALLACPFEPPKLKTNNTLQIQSVEDYKSLEAYEKEKFTEMIRSLKNAGAELVFCQWGFDDEANSLLLEHELPAIRWVGGQDMELSAVYTNGQIISRFEELTSEDLGRGIVEQITLGTENEKCIKLTANTTGTVTILLRGSSQLALDEAERSVIDALCAVRNTLQNNHVVYGGGSFEISAHNQLLQLISSYRSNTMKESCDEELLNDLNLTQIDLVCLEAFADALLSIPMTLAQNANLPPIDTIDKLKNEQMTQRVHSLGVPSDFSGTLVSDMKKQKVFDAAKSKKSLIEMANQLVTMVLKIDEVVWVDDQE